MVNLHRGPICPGKDGFSLKLKKKQLPLLIALGLVAAALLAVAARFDLAIDQAVYAPKNPVAILFEAFCYWPLYLPFALLGAVWTFLRRDNPSFHVLGEVLVVLTFFILFNQSLPNLVERGLLPLEGAALTFAALALTFVATIAAVSLASRWDRPTLRRMELLAKFGVLLCVADNIVINLLKLLWTRARFDDMLAAGDFSFFSPWYQFGSQAGNTSFPSGHTAAACGILTLLLLPLLFERWEKRRGILLASCLLYIAASGFCRLVMGRHFLSDTVAAAVVMGILFLALSCNRRFAAALARAKAPEKEPE